MKHPSTLLFENAPLLMTTPPLLIARPRIVVSLVETPIPPATSIVRTVFRPWPTGCVLALEPDCV
jgi:hypothetical protein